jgi:DNA-binding MarR family transcriptional regulator
MSTDKNVLIDIWLMSLLANRMVSEILEDSPLSVDEFAMYGLISDLAPITAADLVRATGLSPTTISTMVRRCEARGELVRTANPVDARSALLELTPDGYAILSQTVPRLLEAIEGIKSSLHGKHDHVRESLRELDSALRAEMGIGARPYTLVTSEGAEASLDYPGERLTPAQEREARRFIEWMRSRDGD